MKSILKALFSASLIILAVSACSSDDVKDLLTTTVTTSLSEDVHVSVAQSSSLEYSENITFDANSDVVGLDIDGYEITSLTREVTNYTGQATMINDLTLSVTGTTLKVELPDITFEEANNKGPVDVVIDNSTLVALADELAKDNTLTINITASLDDQPAEFDLNLTIHGKVTGRLKK